MPYNKLQPEDELLVNQGSNSYSIKADTLKAEMTNYDKLQSTDLMLVNRGTDSYSVEVGTLKDEIAPKGEIETPVAIISPESGAGMGPENVYPAAEDITGVVETTTTLSTWNQDQTWSTGAITGGAIANTPKDWTPAFNGVTGGSSSANAVLTYSTTYTELILVNRPSWEEKIEVNIIRYDGYVKINDTEVTTELGTPAAPEWVDITSVVGSSGTIEKIAVSDVGTNYVALFGIRLDGRLLVDNGIANTGVPTFTKTKAFLTYTTDNSLSLLTAGQAMTQKPAYTPVTNGIINIEEIPVTYTWSNYLYTSPTGTYEPNSTQQVGWYTGNPGNLFDGSTASMAGGADVNMSWLYWRPPVPLPIETLELHASYVECVRLNGEETNVQMSPSLGSSSAQWYTVVDPPVLLTNLSWQGINGAAARGNAIRINGSIVIDNQKVYDNTELTFASPKDLVNFRVGDVVQGNSYIDFPVFNDNGWVPENSTRAPKYGFDGDLATMCLPTLGGTWDWNFNKMTVLDNIIVYFYNDPTYISINGKTAAQWGATNNTGNNFIEIPRDSLNGSLDTLSISWISGLNYAYLRGIKVDGEFLIDSSTIGEQAVSIVDTNDIANNKLTVSGGGTWANDDTITGPLCQGTGKFVSNINNTLELSNVNGRWCVDNQGVGVDACSDTEYTVQAPKPEDIVFQSANGAPLTTAFSGLNCTLRNLTWTLKSKTEASDNYVDVPGSPFSQPVNVATNTVVPKWDGPPEGLDSNTFYSLKVKYEADSSADDVESSEIYFKTSSGDQPQGVRMSGLRFDSDRLTYLRRTPTADAINAYTVSFWFKPTDLSNYINLYACGVNSNNPDFYAYTFSGTGAIEVWHGGSQGNIITAATLQVNKWSHVVISFNGSQCNIYIDGELDSGSGAMSSPKNTAGRYFDIGQRTNGSYKTNGYHSDFYFVDGQALDASAFGKDYAGLWGPIPSETILNNISRLKSPYDQRANMDEKWSDRISSLADIPIDSGPKLFNGILTGANADVQSNQGSSGVIGFTPAITGSKIEIFSIGNVNKLGINGAEIDAPNEQWVDTGVTSLTSIETRHPNAGNIQNPTGIRVDGRILVDGPADNSQNWSDSLSSAGGFTGNAYGPKAGFDNDTTTFCQANTSTDLVWTPATPITVTSKIEMFTKSNSAYNNKILINGVDTGVLNLPGGGGAGSYKDLNFTGTLTSLTITGGASSSGFGNSSLYGLRIDDKVLVDAGAQWDTSQVWSEGALDITSASNIKNLFDGDLTTQFYADDGTDLTYTPTAPIPVNNSVRMWLYYNSANKENSYRTVTIDGNDYTYSLPAGTNLGSWVDIDISGASLPSTITQIKIGSGVAASSGNTGAVEVDGKILVDPGSFGSNGFYLPFDPAQESANYSSTVTGGTTDTPITEIFDGDLTTGNRFVANSDPQTWNVSSFNLIGPGSLRIYAEDIGYQDFTLNLQGGGTINPTYANADSSYANWTWDLTDGQQVGTIVRECINSNPKWNAVYWNGKILVDHNSIGVDASGQDNHFHDENFGVGNTSQIWSVNSTNMVSPELAFDGRLKTWLSNVANTGERGGFTFTNLTVNSSLIIYRSSFTDGKIFINGTTELDIPASPDDVGTPIDTGFTGALTSVEIQTGSKGAIYGIEVDGELLIDKNIQDTVVDTPIKSYAVLTAGSNGNLETPITGIVPATYGSSDNIYWECTKHDNTELNVRVSPMDTTDATASFYYSTVQGIWSEFGSSTSTSGITPLGTGDRVGVAINFATDNLTIFANDSAIISTGLNGNTKLRPSVAQSGAAAFNFGQQPFAASNVTHDLAAGTVEIDGVTYSTLYQELEGYQVAGGYFYDEKNQRAVRGSDLRKRFGITSADPQLGIYDLTEVPSHQVIGYEKVGSKYQALRDYTPEVRTAQAATAAAEQEVAAMKAQRDQYLTLLRDNGFDV